jgi:hypothetical protein
MTRMQVLDHVRITQVWHALGGAEIRRGRGQAFWRRGDGWTVSLSEDQGVWYDHRDGIGGGILDLITKVQGGSRNDALHWLADYYALPLDDKPLSQERRPQYARAKQDAPGLARLAEMWWMERRAELEEVKADALRCSDFAALGAAAKEHYIIGQLQPAGVIRAYRTAREREPAHTRALVADGERWAQWTHAAIVLLVARWHEDLLGIDMWETDGGVVG